MTWLGGTTTDENTWNDGTSRTMSGWPTLISRRRRQGAHNFCGQCRQSCENQVHHYPLNGRKDMTTIFVAIASIIRVSILDYVPSLRVIATHLTKAESGGYKTVIILLSGNGSKFR